MPTSRDEVPADSIGGKIRFGVIGLGAYATRHLDRLAENSAARVVAVCDVNPQSITRAQASHAALLEHAKSYHDHRELLKGERPDAVIICTPHREHFPQMMNCLKAGAHVLIEKPLGNSSAEAQAVIELARKTGNIAGIAYQRHTMPVFRFIHAEIARGAWGKVRAVLASQQESWKLKNIGTWRHNPDISGGGYLHDGGSHLVGLVLWSTGLTPQTIAAFQDNAGTPVDVNTTISVKFREGALGTLCTMGDVPGFQQDLTIGCENASIYYHSRTGLHVYTSDGTELPVTQDQLPEESNIISNFINAIQGKERIAASLTCGLDVIRFTEAVTKSAAAGGKPVDA